MSEETWQKRIEAKSTKATLQQEPKRVNERAYTTSLTLFLIVLDDTLSKSIDQSNRGIRWNFTSHLEDLDDICLISTKESDKQGKINDLVNESLVAGLQLNAAKTKALKINVSNIDSNYITADAVIASVDSFTYLGNIISTDGWI